MQATLDKVLTVFDKQDRAEVQQTLQEVVAEAQAAHPEHAKLFASHSVFNFDFAKTFNTDQKLTHPQWFYILDKAIEAIGDTTNSAGHIDVESIFSNCYALTVHQITLMYAIKYGTAQALTYLNWHHRKLCEESEGANIASEIVMTCIAPVKRERGYAESLVSCTIRKRYAPAQITNHIKLAAVKYVGHQQQQYQSLKTRLNPLGILPYKEDTTPGLSGSKALSVYNQIRIEELINHFDNAISDLEERVAAIANPAGDTLDEQALNLIRLWSSPEALACVADKRTFRAQAKTLAPTLGLSQHRASIVSDYLVGLFRNHFAMVFKSQYFAITRFKNRSVRRDRSLGFNAKRIRCDAQLETVIQKFVQVKSHYIDKSDQSLLNLALANGISFV